ncbi:Signal transduction histidine kinase [Paenibacillus sp. UNCCL117]|uniref:response regulator n=1 Tax=unclassified Paenibacillus TaxID=185978 RepID=UPI00088C52B9|nr:MULTISPECIES: response regulator [unclassified Paenibacillus]SDC67648.1 Signal transduction histidine kinase [Paenibacillus sp. cl123]SFW23378.1 Signal transduction histidine kinase [Paenibacillus sp. UNCCL117]
MGWLKNLKLIHKLLLMTALPMLGVLYFSISAVGEKIQHLNSMSRLEELTRLAVATNELIHELQIERGLVSTMFGSRKETEMSAMTAQQRETDRSVNVFREAFGQMDGRLMDKSFWSGFETLAERLDTMAEVRAKMIAGQSTYEQSVQYYRDTVSQAFLSNESLKTLSQDVRVSQMLSALLNFSRSKYGASQERSLIFEVLSQNRLEPANLLRLGQVDNEQRVYGQIFETFADPEALALHRSTQSSRAVAEIARQRQLVEATAPGQSVNLDPGAWFQVSTEHIDQMKKTEDTISEALVAEMRAIQQASRNELIAVAVTNGLLLLLALLLSLLVARLLLQPIRELKQSTLHILEGRLETSVTVSSKDEIGDLSVAFQQMIDSLRDVIYQADRITKGDYSQQITPKSEGDVLSIALRDMLTSLKEARLENERQFWLKTQLARLTGMSQGLESLEKLASLLISEVCTLVGAGQGVFYIRENTNSSKPVYVLYGSYAFRERKSLSNRIALGEGLVGQAALEGKTIQLRGVPDDYVQIGSGLGAAAPLAVLVLPVLFEERTIAVLELASFKPFTEVEEDLLEQLSGTLGVVIQSMMSKQQTEELLHESQQLAEELQAQQEELRTANEELEEQTRMLRQSEEKLRVQSEELQTINEELEEKTNYLQLQKTDIEKQNAFIQQSQKELEAKAAELELTSRYKSEFLANMSHELRTPLNSLLILAKSLAANEERNLTEDQIESAKVIYSGGLDLLSLINDILDLSKVEAGKLDIRIEPVRLDMIVRNLQVQFQPVAKDKNLRLDITVDSDVPELLVTDGQRVEQVLKNLLSNAFKFTHRGAVSVHIYRPEQEIPAAAGQGGGGMLAFSVTDTGIGIPQSKQQAIFEAFQQADGSTSRKYGGTGLGLTISRELTRLLGGVLHLQSEEGAGSTFTLYLPLEPEAAAEASLPAPPAEEIRIAEQQAAAGASPADHAERAEGDGQAAPAGLYPIRELIPDDRQALTAAGQEKSILIIEDDPDFAAVLRDLSRKKGFLSLVAGEGFSGLQLARRYLPSAILLDLGLPDMDGLKVLDHLKYDDDTRHIPVHIISGMDAGKASLMKGAVGFLAKPIGSKELDDVFERIEHVLNERIKQVLVIEDDTGNQKAIYELLKHKKLEIHSAFTGEEGIERIRSHAYDCVILDLKLPDMTGQELLDRLVSDPGIETPPMIINTGQELTQEEYKDLNRFTDSIVIKGANSPERLLDEVSLFLHSVQKSLPEKQRQMIRTALESDESLKGRKVLLVDDDLRNTFALSRLLRQHGLDVVMADNGKLALEKLESERGIELVIMDIMMPVMDGYEAMRLIRGNPLYAHLPIIALTAKAMAGDREKCIEGGANDYMTKPVDADKLLSLIRVWLFES